MEVKFKKDAWHRQFQQWAWGENTPNFFSLCPYFWFTIFTGAFTFLIPIIPLVHLLMYIAKNIDTAIENTIDKWIEGLEEEIGLAARGYSRSLNQPLRFFKKLDFWDITDRWRSIMRKKGLSQEQIEELYDKYVASEKVILQIEKIKEKQEVNTLKEKEKDLVFFNIAKFLTPIVLWTKRIVYLVMTLIMMGFTTIFINFLVVHLVFSANLVIGLGIIIGMLGVLFLIILGLVKFAEWYTYTYSHDGTYPFIFKPFVLVGKGAKAFFMFFIDYFKSTKNDYCPGIIWEDKKE